MNGLKCTLVKTTTMKSIPIAGSNMYSFRKYSDLLFLPANDGGIVNESNVGNVSKKLTLLRTNASFSTSSSVLKILAHVHSPKSLGCTDLKYIWHVFQNSGYKLSGLQNN